MVQAEKLLKIRLSYLVGLIVVAISLVSVTLACARGYPTPTPQPTATIVPTDTPIPTAPPTAKPEPTVAPTNTPIPEVRQPTASPTPRPIIRVEPTQALPTPTPSTPPTVTPIPASPTSEPTNTPIPSTPTPTVIVPTSTPTSVPQTTASPTTVVLSGREPPPVTGSRGGEIKVAIPQPPPHQDIHKSVSPILAAWGPGIAYSRLFRYRWIPPGVPQQGIEGMSIPYDPLSSTSAREIICDLCKSWRFENDDILSIQLRREVAWHDTNPGIGRTLNASDVVFSLNRLSEPTIPNSPLVNTISEVRAIGEDTIEIHLKFPDAEIFDKLADARAAVVAPEAINLEGDLTQGPTIGTGPWMQTLFQREAMRFEANRSYFIPELPLLDGIIIAIIEDDQTRVTSLRTGQMDLIQPELPEFIAAVERFDELRWTRSHDSSAGIEIAFNTRRGDLASRSLRAAILYSWNPNSLIDIIHNGQSFVSTGLPLINADWLLPADEINSYFNDRAKALEVLKDAAVPRVGTLEIRVGQFGDEYIETAMSLASAVKSLGFLATVEPVSTRSFAEDVWINRDYDIYVGAPPPQSSVTSTLFSIHHSGAPRNSTGYASKELDLLIEQQTIELDPSIRRELMLEIQREILRGAHLFRAATNVSHWLWWSHLNNVAPSTYRGDSFWLTRLWLGDRVRG